MKVAIVGSGLISGHHLSAATTYKGVDVVGIADLDRQRAEAQASRFGLRGVFSSLDEMLSAVKPDVVHVLTPPHSHAALVTQAVDAGAHVYVEKPMALTQSECSQMTAAAIRAGRQLCIGHCWLHTPAMVRARQLLDSGAAGEVIQAAASYTYDIRRNPSFAKGHWATTLPGGIVEDLAIHPISLLIAVLGKPRSTVGVTRPGPALASGQTQEMRAVLDAAKGPGSVAVSLGASPDLAVLDIFCSRMFIRVNLSNMIVTVERELPVPRKLARGLTNLDLARQLVTGTAGATWRLLRKQLDSSYGVIPLVHAFYRALEEGRPAPVDAGEGQAAVATLRALWPIRSSEPVFPAQGASAGALE